MGFDFTQFQFDAEKRRQLGYKLVDQINQYFSSLDDRAVQLPLERRSFGELHNHGSKADYDRELADENVAIRLSPGFALAYSNRGAAYGGKGDYEREIADETTAIQLNPQLATLARSQLASKIENETVRWIGERVGWDRPFDGTFTSGGNEANFSALALALAAHFPQSVEEGIASIGAQPVFYSSMEAHHSLDKSAGLLGLGRKAIRRIPVNDDVEIDVQKLEAAIERDKQEGRRPFCVVATAGTTNSGAIDDIVALSEVCRRHDLWLHVDGAYGAAASFSDQHRSLLNGIERADSVTLDPHKWLAMPFAAGVILTSRPEMLQRAFGVTTPYMPKVAGSSLIDNFKVSVQWSRRMNSLKLWLTLRVHGRLAYEQLIDRQLQLARDFGAWVQKSEHYDLAAPIKLPILNLRVKGRTEAEIAAANAAVVDEITRDGKRWISLTTVNGRSVIRMMIISYLTTEKHLAGLQQALVAAAKKLTAGAAAR